MGSGKGVRNIATTLQILQKLQSHGLQFMKYITHRDQITQTMHYYFTRLGIDITSIPPVIHIAGTKGKGSTAAFTESILRHQGLTTGLYTSPHLIHVTERFRINGQPVNESLYLQAFFNSWDILNDGITFGKNLLPEYNNNNNDNDESLDKNKIIANINTTILPSSPTSASSSPSLVSPPNPFSSLPPLPGFNFLTLLAIKLFLEAKVDVIILEVGLGGRLDATNVIPKDKVAVCGITTLDYDHVELLGYTIQDIAKEKAGIFKSGVPAITVQQSNEALQTLCEIATKEGTPLFLSDPTLLKKRLPSNISSSLSSLVLGLSGEFQYINASLAIALVDIFHHQRQNGRIIIPSLVPSTTETLSTSRPRSSSFHDSFGSSTIPSIGQYTYPPPVYDNLSILSKDVIIGLQKTQWPGRAQIFDIQYIKNSTIISDANLTNNSNNTNNTNNNLAPLTKSGGRFQIIHTDKNNNNNINQHKVRLYIDGAHTEKSMQEICKWFLQQQQSLTSSSTSKNIIKRYVLLFNCGSDKDVLALLLPLTILPFISIHFTPVPWTLTTRSKLPTLTNALTTYIERRKKMNDHQALEEIEKIVQEYNLQLSTTTTATTKDISNNVTISENDPLIWQKNLQLLWNQLYTDKQFTIIKQRLYNLVVPSSSSSMDTTNTVINTNSSFVLSQDQTTMVHSHYLEALDTIYTEHEQYIQNHNKEQDNTNTIVETHVLVTGSLYLVGNVLEGIGYYPSS